MNVEKILDSSFMDLKEIPIEYLLQIARDTQRDLSIECSANGEISIQYTIPSVSVSTHKLIPEGTVYSEKTYEE